MTQVLNLKRKQKFNSILDFSFETSSDIKLSFKPNTILSYDTMELKYTMFIKYIYSTKCSL